MNRITKVRQVDLVLAVYREGGCRSTKEVAERTGLSIATCSAWTSVLQKEGRLVVFGYLKRWSIDGRGAKPIERRHRSALLNELMPWPDSRISVFDALRRKEA